MPEPPTWPQRPTTACLLCVKPQWRRSQWTWPVADRGYRTCTPCCQRLRDQLADVARRYTRLDPAPGGGDGTRAGPGCWSASPANDHIIAMTDPRSKSCEVARDGVMYVWDPDTDDGAYVAKFDVWHGGDGKAYREEEAPVRSVPQVLGSWAAWIAESCGQTWPTAAARTVPGRVQWLDRRLDWLTRQEEIADFAADVWMLRSQLNPVTGDPRVRIGRCPNTLDDGEHTRECGAVLKAPLHGDMVRCQGCGREWSRVEWFELGRLLEAS